MIDIKHLLAPKATDLEYTFTDMLIISMILRMDSYKMAHPHAYRDDVLGMSSYGEARVGSDQVIVPFGNQMFVKKYLTQKITMAHIDFAEKFAEGHFGRKLLKRDSWEGVVNEHGGSLPLIYRAVKEGTPVTGGLPVYSVTALGKLYKWMGSAFETQILRAEWYPSTIATLDHMIMKDLKKIYIETGADLNMLPFALHDFGGRGVTCAEQAEIGGAAHLVHFMGSDTMEGILAANFYYHCDMAAFSVYATEHSVECSFGLEPEQEVEYILHQINKAIELGLKIVSIVIDGKDTMRATRAICGAPIRDLVISSGIKLVLRPDSGDMMVIVPAMLHELEKAYGYDTNGKGFRKLRHVAILWGDGVDHLAIRSLLGKLMVYGWAADNVIFGSGGALLQKVNRDTFKWAQKASAILKDDVWIGIAKDPITDHGKKSKEGVLTLVRDKNTGEMKPFRMEQEEMPDNLEDMHQLLYYYGRLFNETTLTEVRARAAV